MMCEFYLGVAIIMLDKLLQYKIQEYESISEWQHFTT